MSPGLQPEREIIRELDLADECVRARSAHLLTALDCLQFLKRVRNFKHCDTILPGPHYTHTHTRTLSHDSPSHHFSRFLTLSFQIFPPFVNQLTSRSPRLRRCDINAGEALHVQASLPFLSVYSWIHQRSPVPQLSALMITCGNTFLSWTGNVIFIHILTFHGYTAIWTHQTFSQREILCFLVSGNRV